MGRSSLSVSAMVMRTGTMPMALSTRSFSLGVTKRYSPSSPYLPSRDERPCRQSAPDVP